MSANENYPILDNQVTCVDCGDIYERDSAEIVRDPHDDEIRCRRCMAEREQEPSQKNEDAWSGGFAENH